MDINLGASYEFAIEASLVLTLNISETRHDTTTLVLHQSVVMPEEFKCKILLYIRDSWYISVFL